MSDSPADPGTLPFEAAIRFLKTGSSIRRRGWPQGIYVTNLRQIDAVTVVPRFPAGRWMSMVPPEIVHVHKMVLSGFVLIDPGREETVLPWSPSYLDMTADDWALAYSVG